MNAPDPIAAYFDAANARQADAASPASPRTPSSTTKAESIVEPPRFARGSRTPRANIGPAPISSAATNRRIARSSPSAFPATSPAARWNPNSPSRCAAERSPASAFNNSPADFNAGWRAQIAAPRGSAATVRRCQPHGDPATTCGAFNAIDVSAVAKNIGIATPCFINASRRQGRNRAVDTGLDARK